MAEFIEDTGSGWRVRADDGREYLVAPQTAQAMGIGPAAQPDLSPYLRQQEAHMPPSQPAPVMPQITTPEPSATAPAPTLRGPLARPPAPEPQAVQGLPADPEPDMAALRSFKAEADAAGGVDPSSLIVAPRQQPQAPARQQYATTTSTSTSTTKRLGVEEDIAQLNDAVERQQDAVLEQADAKARLSKKMAAAREIEVDANEQAAINIEDRRRRFEAETNDRMGEIASMQAEFKEAAEDNKQSYWQRQDTGTKIAAAIAVMLGAVSEVYGGRNTGLQIINDTIERDYRSRRDAQADRADAIRGKFTALQAARTVAKDDIEAQIITKDLQLEKVQKMMLQIAEQNGSEEIMARANEKNAILDQERAKNIAQLRPQVQINVARKTAPVGGTSQKDAQYSTLPGGTQFRGEQGRATFMGLPETARSKAWEDARDLNTLHFATRKMREMAAKEGAQFRQNGVSADYAFYAQMGLGAYAKLSGRGTIQEADSKVLGEGFPTALRVSTGDAWNASIANRVNGLPGSVRELGNARLSTYGIGMGDDSPSSFRAGVE